MMKFRCAQCGAQLHGGTTCAERLYRMLTSGGIAEARIGEAFAQYALSHPITYSDEALKVALDVLNTERVEKTHLNCDADETGTTARWWRRFARRASCH
jgi:hypothetical protein